MKSDKNVKNGIGEADKCECKVDTELTYFQGSKLLSIMYSERSWTKDQELWDLKILLVVRVRV